ncbi:hypothetical protein AHAS_Ahas13G0138500 [Arachis hypogaea]
MIISWEVDMIIPWEVSQFLTVNMYSTEEEFGYDHLMGGGYDHPMGGLTIPCSEHLFGLFHQNGVPAPQPSRS